MSDTLTQQALRDLAPGDSVGRLNLAARSGGRWARARCESAGCDPGRDRLDVCPHCNGTGRLPIPRDEFVALLAYCGDVHARAVVPKPPCGRHCWRERTPEGHGTCGCDYTLAAWLAGLARWRPTLPSIAAIYAAEFVVSSWKISLDGPFGWKGTPEFAAVKAAVAWRDGGRTRELGDAWGRALAHAVFPRWCGHNNVSDQHAAAQASSAIAATERLAPGAEAAAREGLRRWLVASIKVGE